MDSGKDGSPGLAPSWAAVPSSFGVKVDHVIQLWTVEGEQKACVPPPASPHEHLPASMISLLSPSNLGKQEWKTAGRRRPGALRTAWSNPSHGCPQSEPVFFTMLPPFYIKFNFMEVTESLKWGHLSATAGICLLVLGKLPCGSMSPLPPKSATC